MTTLDAVSYSGGHSFRELTTFYYSGRKANRVKVSVALSNSFFSLWGRDGPRDKTSGHELLFSASFFVLEWHEFSVALSNSFRSLYSGREAPS